MGESGLSQHFPNSLDGAPFVVGLVGSHSATDPSNALWNKPPSRKLGMPTKSSTR